MTSHRSRTLSSLLISLATTDTSKLQSAPNVLRRTKSENVIWTSRKVGFWMRDLRCSSWIRNYVSTRRQWPAGRRRKPRKRACYRTLSEATHHVKCVSGWPGSQSDDVSNTCKVVTPVSCHEVEVRVPYFTAVEDVSYAYKPYKIISAVSHFGDTPQQGHYRSYLRDPSTAPWYITDDKVKARKADARDMDFLCCNAYLIWLSEAMQLE